jgi:hypothetical protein
MNDEKEPNSQSYRINLSGGRSVEVGLYFEDVVLETGILGFLRFSRPFESEEHLEKNQELAVQREGDALVTGLNLSKEAFNALRILLNSDELSL